jgi:hypothetical protein
MDAKAAVRHQMAEMHGYLELAIGDCPPEVLAKWLPGATINSVGTIYAHTVFAEDGLLNGLVMGETPVYHQGGWAQKIGIEMPAGGFEGDWDPSLDLALFRQYAAGVCRSMERLPGNGRRRRLGAHRGPRLCSADAGFSIGRKRAPLARGHPPGRDLGAQRRPGNERPRRGTLV